MVRGHFGTRGWEGCWAAFSSFCQGKGTQGGGSGGVGGGTGTAPGTEDKHSEKQSYTQQQPKDDGHDLSSSHDPGNYRHVG